MVLDYESMWAVQRDSLPRADLDYLDRARALYRALWEAGVTVDVRHPSDDLSGYALVLAPTLHLVTDADAANLADYVRRGGHLVLTYFSGIVDENDHVRLGGYPGAFRDLLGVRVEEFCPLPATTTVTLTGGPSGQGDPSAQHRPETAGLWTEDLTLTGATAVRSYRDGPMAGRPAVTRNEVGAGAAWYVATRTDPAATAALMAEVLEGAGVRGGGVPPGVEIVRRTGRRPVLHVPAQPHRRDRRGGAVRARPGRGPGLRGRGRARARRRGLRARGGGRRCWPRNGVS